jgi:hypothetical protein
MLFFELFPLFMLFVCLVVGVWLYVADREASRAEKAEDAEPINRKDR